LRIVAEILHRNGRRITLECLTKALLRHVQPRSPGQQPSPHTIQIILQRGKPWLSSRALITKPARTKKFVAERCAFSNQPVSNWACLPSRLRFAIGQWTGSAPRCRGVRSLKSIAISHVDAFLMAQTSHGWSRQSVRVLGGRLRSLFRYAASQRWCRPELALSIALCGFTNLPMLPKRRVPSMMETIHVARPKMSRTQTYPMSVPVGEAILRYLRHARPRSGHRSLLSRRQSGHCRVQAFPIW
jgi:hypothetical protein